MQTHDSYLGLDPFNVLIDESPELEDLVLRTKALRGDSFEEKLESLKIIVLASMINAYEQWKSNPSERQREFYKDIVMKGHPLSYALQQKAGCCRYMGALFFVLAYEADLGDKQFIQQAPVDPVRLEWGGMRSVFNDIVHNRELHLVLLFKESLENPEYDYSKKNPRVYDSAIGFGLPKGNPCSVRDPWNMRHYSYHRTDEGLVIVSQRASPVKKYSVDE